MNGFNGNEFDLRKNLINLVIDVVVITVMIDGVSTG
jgi:hypothetical protein